MEEKKRLGDQSKGNIGYINGHENHICELRIRREYKSDLRSNEHYLSSSENKA